MFEVLRSGKASTVHLLFQFSSLTFCPRPFITGTVALVRPEDPCHAGCSQSYLISR